MVADDADGGGDLRRVGADDLAHPGDELGLVAVEGHHVGLVGGEPVIDHHFPAAGLVQDGDFDAVAEGRDAVGQDDVDVLDEGVVADPVVGDIVLDVLDAAVVADLDVAQGRVVEAGVLADAAGEFELGLEDAEADVSVEAGRDDIIGGKALGDKDFCPV